MSNNPSSPQYWFIVPAAGIGQRMQSSTPKQYLPLADTTVLEKTLSTLLSVEGVRGIIVALHEDDRYWPSLSISQYDSIHTVIGGAERSDSVLAALTYLKTSVCQSITDDDWILVHDAARPCVRNETIQALIDQLRMDSVGGILAVPASDTLKRVGLDQYIEKTVDREQIWQAQTPQMFRYGVLSRALLSALPAQQSEDEEPINAPLVVTDEASAVEYLGLAPKVVHGRQDNIKITQPDDLWLAEMILRRSLN